MSADPVRGISPAARLPGTLVDRVSDQCPGAREIGFSITRRYNASSILFDNLARGHGARTAIVGPGGHFSYAALCAQANRAANSLRSLGLNRGGRILLLLDDTPMFPIFFFGAVRAGFVPVPLNTLAPPELLRFHLLDANARIVVADADLLDRLTVETVRDTPLETTIVCNGERMGGHLRARPAASWLAGFSELGAAADTGRDEMALWMYSSGSTGRPKGIVHLQHDLAYVVASYARYVLKLEPEDVCYSPPKMFFSYGFGNSLLFPFSAGASSVLCPGRPTPDRVFGALARYRPSVFFGLPTLYTALAKAPEVETADFSSLRLCVSAAETLSREISLAWTACSGLPVVECLGSTEMLNVSLSKDADDRG